MKRWAIFEGSMILSEPTMTLADEETCSSPFFVNGISLCPVYRPEIVHSVSPVTIISKLVSYQLVNASKNIPHESAYKTRGQSVVYIHTVSYEEDSWSSCVLVGHLVEQSCGLYLLSQALAKIFY